MPKFTVGNYNYSLISVGTNKMDTFAYISILSLSLSLTCLYESFLNYFSGTRSVLEAKNKNGESINTSTGFMGLTL